jgi:hypothetical protein
MGVQQFVSQTLRRPAYVLPVAFVVLLLDFVALMVTGPTRVRTGTDRAGAVQPGEEASPVESLPPEEAAAAAARAATARRSSSSRAGGSKVGVDTAISDTEIAVGMIYVTNPGTANAAAGFQGVGQINQKRGWELMVKEVNKVAPGGRKVVPVWYSTSEENAISKGEGIWEEACAHWTKDNKIFLAWAGGTNTLRACLTKNRVAQIAIGSGLSDAETFKKYPWYVEPNSAALDRMAEFEVDQLVARGYFAKCRTNPRDATCVDGKPRVALIRYDQPVHKAAAARMKAALARHGLSLCDGCEFEVTMGATADVAAQLDDATEVNNAIVSCKSPHTAPGTQPGPCTHQLFLGSTSGCRIMFFYVQAAEQQQYRVRIGMNSIDQCSATQWDGTGQPEYADNQFPESVLVGHDPEGFGLKPAAFNECKKLFTDGGETFGGDDTSNNKEGQIPGYCDTAWYHTAVFNKIGKTVNLDTFLNGVATTGLVKSAGTFLMQTTATRHDGAGAIRIGHWDPGECRCWKPVTGDIPV